MVAACCQLREDFVEASNCPITSAAAQSIETSLEAKVGSSQPIYGEIMKGKIKRNFPEEHLEVEIVSGGK